MSRRKWSAAFLALVLGVLAATPGRAVAGTVPWPGTAICAQGTLVAVEPNPTTPTRVPLDLTIEPCAGSDPAAVATARWGVAFYGFNAEILQQAVESFAADGPVSGRVDGLRGGFFLEYQAACLITGPENRVACVRAQLVRPAGTLIVTPIGVDDPLVHRTVRVLDGVSNPEPECGACV